MTIDEIKVVYELQCNSKRPIYLQYTRPSGKTGIAYFDNAEEGYFRLYKIRYSSLPINDRNMQATWSKDDMLEVEAIDMKLYALLKKAQGGHVYAPIDGIAFQNPKKAAKLRILYGK